MFVSFKPPKPDHQRQDIEDYIADLLGTSHVPSPIDRRRATMSETKKSLSPDQEANSTSADKTAIVEEREHPSNDNTKTRLSNNNATEQQSSMVDSNVTHNVEANNHTANRLVPKRQNLDAPQQDNDEQLIAEKMRKVEELLARMPKKVAQPAVADYSLPKVANKAAEQLNITPKVEPKVTVKTRVKTASSSQQAATVVEKSETPLKETTASPAEIADAPETELLTDNPSFRRRQPLRNRENFTHRFQTLVFQVGKLPLAVPLAKLGGIHRIAEDDLTPLIGRPDWFMGIIPEEQGNLMLVDTAKFLMPEKYNTMKDSIDYRYAIILDDTRWALACNSVGDAKMLDQDDIRWSEKNSSRKWFSGMVVQFMCALLEVDELINLLLSHSKQPQGKATPSR